MGDAVDTMTQDLLAATKDSMTVITYFIREVAMGLFARLKCNRRI